MNAAIFVNHPLQQLDTKANSIHFGLYDALSRVCWSIGWCYIIFACVHNSGGYVNWFLSHPYWKPISRICYSTYLVHFQIILAMTASLKTSLVFNQFAALQDFIGMYLLTIIVSIIATLAFESPILIIEQFIHNSVGETTKLRSKSNGNTIEIRKDSSENRYFKQKIK